MSDRNPDIDIDDDDGDLVDRHVLLEYRNLPPGGIDNMIRAARQQCPFLEFSDVDRLRALCLAMIDEDFCFTTKPTPIKSAFEFLEGVDTLNARNAPGRMAFTERDFVFAIKMFGLCVRNALGVWQFVPDNALDKDEDNEVNLVTAEDARKMEFYLSPAQVVTRAQGHSIESARTKLARHWKETQLARVFGKMVTVEGKKVGEARDYLRTAEGGSVKDHVFVRVRAIAIRKGWYSPSRATDGDRRRVTLDPANADFVMKMARKGVMRGSPVNEQANLTEATNRFIHDMRAMLAAGSAAGTQVVSSKSSARA